MKTISILAAAILTCAPALAQGAAVSLAPGETVDAQATAPSAPAVSQPPTAAADTTVQVIKPKTIYIGQLGDVSGAGMIRQKVILGLIKSGVVRVIEAPDRADLQLLGAAEMSQRHHVFGSMYGGYGSVSGGSRFTAECVARLVDKDGNVIWSDDLTSSRFFVSHRANWASSNVADKIVKAIATALAPPVNQLAAKQSATTSASTR